MGKSKGKIRTKDLKTINENLKKDVKEIFVDDISSIDESSSSSSVSSKDLTKKNECKNFAYYIGPLKKHYFVMSAIVLVIFVLMFLMKPSFILYSKEELEKDNCKDTDTVKINFFKYFTYSLIFSLIGVIIANFVYLYFGK